MRDVRKDIRFIDSNYKEQFRMKDGDSIKFTSGYDGEVKNMKCRFIDEAHTEIGMETYHICQFAEICERNSHKFAPAEQQESKIDILTAKYGEDLQAVEIPMTEDALKELVGGSFETEMLHYPNKTAQNKGRIVEIKGEVYGAVIRGKEGIAVCGLTDGILTSLHPYNEQTCKRELSPAERKEAIKAEKESLLGELAGAKAILSERTAADTGERSSSRQPSDGER